MPLKEFKAKLVPEVKEINVFVNRNLLSSALAGELMSMLKGRGIEFEDYRDYTVTDDAQRIDWRASKRSQKLLVREYKLEVNFNVFFLIDVSESMLYSSTDKLKCEYAAQLATSLYYGILQTGNSVGFGLFSDKMFKVFTPLLDKKQFYIFTKEISKPENYGGKKNMTKALQQLLTVLNRKGMLIIISDFISNDDSWLQFFKILGQKHDIVGIMVRDPRDNSLPKDAGQFVFEDPFSEKKIYIDAKDYYFPYQKYNQKQLNILRSVFQSNKSSLMELTTDKHYLDELMMFFRKRGGRWR